MFGELVGQLADMTDAELKERIDALELARRELDAELSAALAMADARNLHGAEGHRSMTTFCRARLNWSSTEARRRLSLARAVNEVSGLGEAWHAGHIGLPQAIKLAIANGNRRVTEPLHAYTSQLLDHAEKMPYADFSDTVDHFVKRADEDGAYDDRDASIEARRAHVVDVGGTLDVRASGGGGLITAEITAIYQRFVDAEYAKDVEARRAEHGDAIDGVPLPRTDAQRRFDALVAIFRAAHAAEQPGSAAEPLVNIVIDSATWSRMLSQAGLASDSDVAGNRIDPFTGLAIDEASNLVDDLVADNAHLLSHRCETASGVPLLAHDVLRSALSGHIRRVVIDAEQVVIDMGRKQRVFTGSARQAAQLLMKRCEHVGCELPASWCDVDHVEEWHRDHGATDQRNGSVLCQHSNLDKHRKRWRTRRATNGCSYTIRHDGTVVLPVGARPPEFPEPH